MIRNPPALIEVTVGHSYSSLAVLDIYDDDEDAITIRLASDSPSGMILSNSLRTLKWNNVQASVSGRVEVIMTDARGASSSWTANVKICNCLVSIHR